jgi:hypothetical protein
MSTRRKPPWGTQREQRIGETWLGEKRVKRCAGREVKFEPPNVAAVLVTIATRAPF